MKEIDKHLASFEAARQNRLNWEDLWQECYEYAIPRREDFYTDSEHQTGDARMNNIYDETALNAVPEFASRMLAGIAPPMSNFIMLKAGEFVPEQERDNVDRGLQSVQKIVQNYFSLSNFDQEMYEAMIEVAVGTAVMLIEETNSATVPFKFTAVPINRVWLEKDAFDQVGGVYYKPALCARDIKVKWPSAEISPSLAKIIEDQPNKKIDVLDYTYTVQERFDDTVFERVIIVRDTNDIIYRKTYEGDGANPWVAFRWSKTAGEVYGRGPLIQALPAIKIANLVKKLLLENAAIQVSGIWQAEDDGVLNPNTVILAPGAIIPKAPNSSGLTPLSPNSNFDLSQFLLQDLQFNIRKALYNESLGRPDKTPMTATEVAERMADLARQIGSPLARLISEGMQAIVRRVMYILRERKLIAPILIDNKTLNIQFDAPLAQAQKFDKIVARQRFMGDIQGFFGPEMQFLMTKPYEYILAQAKDYGIDIELLNNKAQVNALQQRIAQGVQQANGEQQ